MSTTELKAFIDSRTAQEKGWLFSYLLGSLREVPEVQFSAEDLAELQQCSADLVAGKNRVTQAAAEAHWDELDAKGA